MMRETSKEIFVANDHSIEVSSEEALLTALEALRNEHASREPALVCIGNSDRQGPTLLIGVGLPDSVLIFQCSDDPPYFSSRGKRCGGPVVTFHYGGYPTELPGSTLIPWHEAREAAVYFYRTGERDPRVSWGED